MVLPLLEVSDLTVSNRAGAAPVRILDDVGFTLAAGQTLGVVGESGSGKTVLIRAVLGLLEPPWQVEAGSVRLNGDDLLRRSEAELLRLRGKELALTSPEPRKHLNPLLRIGEQLVKVLRAHAAMPHREARERAVALLRQVGIPDPERRAYAYPHELSGGMCQRVIIAMALAHSPKLILADEPTAGLDVTISRQILDLMQELVRQAHSSLILVSRDLGVVAHYCERVAVMHAGRIVEIGDVPGFFAAAVHPYSRNLLRAAAARDQAHEPTLPQSGTGAPQGPGGCSYAGRCALAERACRERVPALEAVAADYSVRCRRQDEIRSGRVSA
ncbi:MAG: ABC transporter ATP-binding protein [Dongiaceae bacterium]